MTTWGPSKRRSKRSRAAPSRPAPPREPASATTRATSSRRDRATAEVREGIDGREHEFVGVGLIVGGVLLALATFFDLAGPLGRGLRTLLAWVFGFGLFAVPLVLIGVGISLVHRGRSTSPLRLVIGWSLIAVATLGLLHVIGGPEGFTDLDELDDAGGLIGAVVGEPLQALLASAGAIVVMVGVVVGGALLITQTSLRTMATRTGRSVGTVARPIGRAARQALRDLSSLSSDEKHDGTDADATMVLGDRPLPPPTVYDAANDFGDGQPERTRRKASPPVPAGPTANGDADGPWTLPPISLLHRTGTHTINRAQVEARGRVLQESLEQHGVDTSLVGMTVGPTVTRYELELAPGVKVARVTSLQRDIAYAMAATDVRILAPIPGRSAIGVEVPNHTRQLVALGDLLVSPQAAAATGPLEVAIGKDIAGNSVFLDLATTPHLLIAGATGAGKSSGLNCMITSLLMRTTPEQVRLILVDPKQVEMGQYHRLPHLLTQPVTNPKKAANALGWAVKEMDRRYDVLSEVGFRDIVGYNAAFDRGELTDDRHASESAGEYSRLPYIVVVVDELNDLMMVAARDVEDSITRIAQKARAVGIHLIVATQRPSVNVITGVIKANIPARIAFAVSSLTDSRVILDQPGAERLVGKGDMLLLPGNSSVAQRIQGAFVGEDEVRKVVAHWRRQAPDVVYVSGVEGEDRDDAVTSAANAFSAGVDEDDDAAILRQAMELVVRSQLGLDIDAAAQAEDRVRPCRAGHGPPRATRRGGAERGLQGPRRADDGRGVRAAAAGRTRLTSWARLASKLLASLPSSPPPLRFGVSPTCVSSQRPPGLGSQASCSPHCRARRLRFASASHPPASRRNVLLGSARKQVARLTASSPPPLRFGVSPTCVSSQRPAGLGSQASCSPHCRARRLRFASASHPPASRRNVLLARLASKLLASLSSSPPPLRFGVSPTCRVRRLRFASASHPPRLAAAHVAVSAVEDRQVQLAQAGGVGEDVDGDDPPAPDREAADRERLSVPRRDQSRRPVDEHRLQDQAELRVGLRLAGHRRRPADLPPTARRPRAEVGSEHDIGVEHGDQSIEVPSRAAARKASTTSRCASRSASGTVCSAWTRRRARLASWRAASGERSMIEAISSKGTANMSCSTNANRSAGLSVSRTTSKARPTESASRASCSGSVPSARSMIGSGTWPPIGSSRRRLRVRSMFSEMRATTVVSHPPSCSISLVSLRLSRNHAS